MLLVRLHWISVTIGAYFHRDPYRGYQWERLPEAVVKLQKGEYAPLIDCTFDLGAPCDPEALINEREGWTLHDWQMEWYERRGDKFETVSPLPPWSVLHRTGSYTPTYYPAGLC
jgi:hypothetical protein